jgi:uncharacterized protein (TIGR03083 family)
MGVNDTPHPPDDTPVAPPGGLGDTVIRAAGARRAPNEPRTVGADATTPVHAMWQTAQELYGLLTRLTADDWSQPTTTEYGSVHDLVAHLVGIERYFDRAISHRDDPLPPAEAAHLVVARRAMEELRDVPGSDLAAQWFDAVAVTVAAFQADTDDRPIDVHGIPLPRDLAIVFRTFELWAHMEDVCAALGRPLPRLDGPRMGLMAATLVGVLPLFVALPSDGSPARTARIVLLGPGGGVADLSLGDADETSTAPSVRLVADIVDFCRIASRRLPVEQLDRQVTGDATLIGPVLEAAAAFAMD